MDKEVRKIILGTVHRMLWEGWAWRGEWLKGLLRPILRFQLPLCWGVLCTLAACYFQGLTYLCFSISGHICRLALKFRRVTLLEPPFQLIGEGYREYRLTSHPAGGKLRGTFYIHGFAELPQERWALFYSVGISTLTHLWSPSLLSLAHFSSSLNPAPH